MKSYRLMKNGEVLMLTEAGVMTVCGTCKADLKQRVWLTVKDCGEQAPLFAETYECGAIKLWGLVEGSGVARSCPKENPL